MFTNNFSESLSSARGKLQVGEMKNNSNAAAFSEATNKNQMLSVRPNLGGLCKTFYQFQQKKTCFLKFSYLFLLNNITEKTPIVWKSLKISISAWNWKIFDYLGHNGFNSFDIWEASQTKYVVNQSINVFYI